MFFLKVDLLEQILRYIGATFCNLIYSLISWLYQLFMTVARLNLLSSDEVQPIYQRVTMILTIVMVFYITFEVVKYVVSPNTITDKEKGAGNIAMRMIIVIVLIAFVPKIFSIAYDLQSRIISNQVISKVILGQVNADYDSFGSDFSANMINLFYHVDESVCSTGGSDCEKARQIVEGNLANLRETGNVTLLPGLMESKKMTVNGESTEVALIKFDGLLAIIVGGFIVYILVLYSIDVGTRYAQLIFLQIMAPVAIIGYISPKKDGMFQKWTKQCMTTYLDLFIRLAIINFILLIVDVLGDSFSSGSLFTGLGDISSTIRTFTYIVLVIGLLAFAQKAPKMLQDILPTGGGAASIGYGLGGKGRFEGAQKAFRGVTGMGRRTAGAISGAATGIGSAIKNRKNLGTNQNRLKHGLSTAYSATKAVARGINTGAGKDGNIRKANEAARQSIQKDIDVRESGGSQFGSDFFGGAAAATAKSQDMIIARYETMVKKKKEVTTAIKDIKFRSQMDKIGEALVASGNADAAKKWEGQKKAAEKLSRNFADGNIDATTFETRMQTLVADFNTDNRLTGTPAAVSIEVGDLETGNAAKWSKVKTAIDEAKGAAKDINGQTYVKPDGTTATITYVESTFANDIGDITDGAEAAAIQLKASDKYKKAHANAQGSGKPGK